MIKHGRASGDVLVMIDTDGELIDTEMVMDVIGDWMPRAWQIEGCNVGWK